MSWKVYQSKYSSDSDFSNGAKSIKVKMTKNVLLQVVRTWITFVNNPGMTNITCKLYYDEDGEVGDLAYSSTDTHLKAEIITENNGVKEVYFTFERVPLDANNFYHIVLSGSSSGLSESSFIGWKTSYPDPVYTGGFSQTFSNLPKYPYTLSLAGIEL